jgi:hypothetical protein
MNVTDYAEFIETWWDSDTTQEVVERFGRGLDRRDAQNEAAGLRRRGVPMKDMQRRPRPNRPNMTALELQTLRLAGEKARDRHQGDRTRAKVSLAS